jgi:hypothetical protein
MVSSRRFRAIEPLADPSSAYGLTPPFRVKEPGRGRRVLRDVVLFSLLFPAFLAFGAGQLGATQVDLDAWRRMARAEAIIGQTMDALAAYSFEAVSAMNGSSIGDGHLDGAAGYRVDLSVTPSPSGILQIQATVFDERTSRAVSRFVTWRGRS